MFFELTHKDKNCYARTGVIHTDHGDIATPIFMPVGTQASVKTLDCDDLKNINAQIILGNTYHLHLRPGEDTIDQIGGLHKFMNWDRPILTDSGGFQVFSLGAQKEANLVSIDEDGATFKSHLDGSTHRFTPESAIQIQHKLGADIIMAFDECTPDNIEEKYVREAMTRTHNWAKRSLAEHQKETNRHDYKQFLFGIIQGSNFKNLREDSARFISALDFDGIAIGGESIGYNMEATKEILDWVYPIIPENKPHYAMGVGLSPLDMLVAVSHGVDMFDCVAPTRLARHGMLFTHEKNSEKYRINITNAQFALDLGPIDKNCGCHTCQNYSRAYLHHLFNAQEITGMRLATIHNLYFMLNLMKQAREAIKEDKFEELLQKWI
ncbi:MAG: tRNA guanosine(34) transglycosylase Tgt [Patescibacteria group bacterium]